MLGGGGEPWVIKAAHENYVNCNIVKHAPNRVWEEIIIGVLLETTLF